MMWNVDVMIRNDPIKEGALGEMALIRGLRKI